MTTTDLMPLRTGERPLTTKTNPHYQLNQHPPLSMIAELADRCFALPGVTEHPSLIGPIGTRAMWLERTLANGPRSAFIIVPEFAHIHHIPDGSLHLALPDYSARLSYQRGWTEPHPFTDLSGDGPKIMLLYAPRDPAELAVVFGLITTSYRFACGELPQAE